MKFKFHTQAGVFEVEGTNLKITSQDIQITEKDRIKALVVRDNLAFMEVLSYD